MAEDDAERSEPDRASPPGASIVGWSWITTVVFSATALGDWAGIDAMEAPATAVALAFFGVGLVVWGIAFAVAIGRSRTDEVTLTGLYLLVGTAPRGVQIQLLGSFTVAVVVAALTAVQAPFGVMEPVLPLALNGLWGARHGRFGPRRVHQRDRPRDRQGEPK